jgi:hypothetical protein
MMAQVSRWDEVFIHIIPHRHVVCTGENGKRTLKFGHHSIPKDLVDSLDTTGGGGDVISTHLSDN